MTRHRLEVADVVRSYESDFLAEYGDSLSPEQRRVLKAVAQCRTAALGGHVEACDHCGHRRIAYNSCRNRHCPKCQAAARAQWMEERSAELLPVQYFHLVFTLPESLGPVALQNPRVVYGILFQAVADTLLTIAADAKHLGARIGVLAILHTWGQNLSHHPHIHCVVPGGGLALDGSRWVNCRSGFFLPVRILSRVFRGKFIHLLKRAYRTKQLRFHGEIERLRHPNEFERLLNFAVRTDWVVHSKPPFGGPKQVLKYLARYTHRVAISNDRLVSMDNGQIHFTWKDYARGSARNTMTLDAVEFLRRFLLHVLPTGFVKIRYYGFLANRARQQHLSLARHLLGDSNEAAGNHDRPSTQIPEAVVDSAPCERCPACQHGRMKIIERLLPHKASRTSCIPFTGPAWDTS